jgi:putative Holliday junction resolvase
VGNIARIIGLDVGDSRIGVALSDPLGIMATPMMIINRADQPKAVDKIVSIIREKEVAKIIVGLPLNMDGTRGNQAEKTDTFVNTLRVKIEIPVEYRDERLSTVNARELIQGVRKTDRSTRYDAAAAALILQGYLDETSGPQEIPPEPEST